ncbi:MAG TPA: AraC family transcriptional regulator [Aquabacterium sp.]|nr:AraC family transcriptional regulator [Aquabacterium sp.]
MTQHTVAVQQVRLIVQGARHRGLAVPALLQRAGIPPALLDAPLARVSQAQYALLIRVLRRTLRDELWGLCSRPLPVGSFGRCAAMLVRCATLEEALRLGLRHYHGLLADFVPRLVVQGGVARLQLMRRAPRDPVLDPRLDYAQKAFLLFAFGLACWLVARRVPVLSVDYTEPAPRSDSSRVYQAPIRHDQAHVGLCFDARWLELPVVQNPQSLREFLAGAPANLLIKYRDAASVSERIRRLLHRRLDAGDLSLEAVGEALAIAPPTLRRRLREEGHGFQALKDALRRDAAIAHLARPELTLPEIAERLGFSEASTFHRAFKKWTGVAPGEYRLTRMAAVPGIDVA